MRDESLQVWVDQDLCTGDGLCVQYARDVFEFDIDGLAYVKNADGELKLAEGARVPVPAHLRLDVIDAAKDCPGECIHVVRATDQVEVAGPESPPEPSGPGFDFEPSDPVPLRGFAQSGRPTSDATVRANSSSRPI